MTALSLNNHEAGFDIWFYSRAVKTASQLTVHVKMKSF